MIRFTAPNLVLALAVMVTLLEAGTATAEAQRVKDVTNAGAFWGKNMVSGVVNGGPMMELPLAGDPYKIDRPPVKPIVLNEASEADAAEGKVAALTTGVTKRHEPTTPEELFAEYGSAYDEPKIFGADNAPAPLKAAHRALNMGRPDLAALYMLQTAKYFDLVQGRSKDLAGMETMMRAVNEGKDPKELLYSDEMKELYAKLEPTLREYQEKQSAKLLDESDIALLEKARQEPLTAAPALDEEGEPDLRKQTRTELAGKIPVDPTGVVHVYFFFTPADDDRLRLMLTQMDQLRTNHKKSGRVRIEAYSMLALKPGERKHIQDTFKLSMPVLNGRDFAEKLNLKSSPTVLFEAASTHQTHVEYGFLAFERMDEIIRLMRGDT